jgi:drug/metabolite transporter (DMT)-like permease
MSCESKCKKDGFKDNLNSNQNMVTTSDEVILLNKSSQNDYSTMQTRSLASIAYNENTSMFDLWKGLFFMFLSCLFKSLFSILSKYALKDKADFSSFQLLTYRTYFMMWISILLVSTLPINVFSERFIKKDKILYVFVRSIFAIISMSLIVFSIKYIHISDVYSVYYIYPAFIIILSYFFMLKENLGLLDYTCLSACFVGALLIVKPDFIFHNDTSTEPRMYFFAMVLFASLLKAIEDVLIRNVGKDAHYLSFPFMYSILGMIIFPIPMIIYDKVYPTLSFGEVIVIFLIAGCTFLYQMFMALGLQNESASRVSMVNYIQVALMFISDLAFFDKKFNWLDLIGTLLIFCFNFANGFYKAVERWKNLNNYKKNLQ